MSRLYYILAAIIALKMVLCASQNYKDNTNKSPSKAATFHFPEYAYKETSKNEIIYHDFELACSQNSLCGNNPSMVSKLNCLRKCISHSCYQDIYAFDELEDGEIDVRMNSFKGCVIQRM
ncbi:uncharacterized protein LOC6572286 [Drosophila mojavensis]|uniref:Uncharacterized protein n=3 Tax=mojavensis species complex TaxID=198037 RepID=B4KDQ3_DROMO|nr:uncharacterized protein LOC6572286 [Drosophila mojavensis]XP_017874967.1 PREDICTED: uncharacterized protein LOC108621887 [Drosophila arizonae]EDW13887.1 uncharacterized protein Dmoj_GI23957 [Drosophila mojavensis]